MKLLHNFSHGNKVNTKCRNYY